MVLVLVRVDVEMDVRMLVDALRVMTVDRDVEVDRDVVVEVRRDVDSERR